MTARIVLMQCPVAGFQFHAGEKHWRQLRLQDPLSLMREPGNRHDPRAVRLEWQGFVLGYVPEEANYAVSQMMDRGEQVCARIVGMRESQDPWMRVMVEVDWAPDPHRDGAVRGDTTVCLGSFVLTPPPAKIQAASHQLASPIIHQMGMSIMDGLRVEISRRLALPAVGISDDRGRRARIWDIAEISVGLDGRGLSIHLLEDNPISRPRLSASLSLPVAPLSWSSLFDTMLGRALAAHGVPAEAMPGARGRFMHCSITKTFGRYVDFSAMRRALLEFLAPDPLTRSLANRIFGHGSNADEFNWCGEHREALALAAVEHPGLAPFFRMVYGHPEVDDGADPVGVLEALCVNGGMMPAAWKRLEHWEFEAFEQAAENERCADFQQLVIDHANLLLRLDATKPPPPAFNAFARSAPDWFLRALLRACELLDGDEDEENLRGEVELAYRWLASNPREPDANQKHAGWRWILDQATHLEIQNLLDEWLVPCADFQIGAYRFVAIRNTRQLEEEAFEMSNCLASFAVPCLAGELCIFSVRRVDNAKRVACFSIEKREVNRRRVWVMASIKAKGNHAVKPEVDAAARQAMTVINRPNVVAGESKSRPTP